jgi:hypothetical protein
MTYLERAPAGDQPSYYVHTEERTTAYVDWGAIFVGSLISLAVSLLASAFGAAIGLSIANPYNGPTPLFFYWAAGLWLLWVTILTFLAGGYTAGRLRRRAATSNRDEAEYRDGMHGLAVWGIVVIMGLVFTSPLLSKATKTTEDAIKAIGPQVKYADLLLRGDGDVKNSGEPIDENTRKIVERIIVLNPNGDFSERDRSFLQNLVSVRTSFPPSEAAAHVAEVSAEMKADVEAEKVTLNKARKVGVILSFITASTLAVGAAASWSAAKRGAAHKKDYPHKG